MLDHFEVTAETWREAIGRDPHFAASETPRYLGRGVAAVAADPDVASLTGHAFGSWDLARKYGVEEIDGSRPDWGTYYREVVRREPELIISPSTPMTRVQPSARQHQAPTACGPAVALAIWRRSSQAAFNAA